MEQGNFPMALEHMDKAKALLDNHVDIAFWLNVQLVQLQYYTRTKEYDKSIALIDEVTSVVLNHDASIFATFINYKHLPRLIRAILTEQLKLSVT